MGRSDVVHKLSAERSHPEAIRQLEPGRRVQLGATKLAVEIAVHRERAVPDDNTLGLYIVALRNPHQPPPVGLPVDVMHVSQDPHQKRCLHWPSLPRRPCVWISTCLSGINFRPHALIANLNSPSVPYPSATTHSARSLCGATAFADALAGLYMHPLASFLAMEHLPRVPLARTFFRATCPICAVSSMMPTRWKAHATEVHATPGRRSQQLGIGAPFASRGTAPCCAFSLRRAT